VDRAQAGSEPGADGHDSDLGPGAAVPGNSPSPQESGSRARVIAASLRCVARYGVSKTTVDDVARQAGLSRATLYRAFPGGRDQILSTMLDTEIRRYFTDLAARLDDARDLEELLIIALTTGADQIARHDTLRFLLAHEPEVIVPYISFGRFDDVLSVTGAFLEPYLVPSLGRTQARRVAEWVTRLVISHVACPPGAADKPTIPGLAPKRSANDTPFALHPEPIGEERARRLVRQFVIPGIDVLSASER
jgi:AcrR family transcriptional regulator